MPSGAVPADPPTPEETERAKQWVRTWQDAGLRLEAIRQRELRELDSFHTIGLLLADWDYHTEPRAPRPSSGLIEQQRLFAIWRQA